MLRFHAMLPVFAFDYDIFFLLADASAYAGAPLMPLFDISFITIIFFAVTPAACCCLIVDTPCLRRLRFRCCHADAALLLPFFAMPPFHA